MGDGWPWRRGGSKSKGATGRGGAWAGAVAKAASCIGQQTTMLDRWRRRQQQQQPEAMHIGQQQGADICSQRRRPGGWQPTLRSGSVPSHLQHGAAGQQAASAASISGVVHSGQSTWDKHMHIQVPDRCENAGHATQRATRTLPSGQLLQTCSSLSGA